MGLGYEVLWRPSSVVTTIPAISTATADATLQGGAAQSASPLAFRGTYAVAGKKDPAQQFEAFVLQSFVQELLPKESEAVFGGGLAGEYWRSMLAERLGEVLAETGSIGISEMVRDSVKLNQAAKVQVKGAASISAAALNAAGPAEGDATAISVLAGSETDGE